MVPRLEFSIFLKFDHSRLSLIRDLIILSLCLHPTNNQLVQAAEWFGFVKTQLRS